MRKRKILLFIVITIFFVINLSSLSKIPKFKKIILERGGEISENKVWRADTVKVTSDVYIKSGVTLTIEPGTYVEFQGYYGIMIEDSGRLVAIGTKRDSIIFTVADRGRFVSNKDYFKQLIIQDSEDTIDKVKYKKSGWKGISFCYIDYKEDYLTEPYDYEDVFFDKISKFEYCKFEGANDGAIKIRNNSGVKISNSLFINNYLTANLDNNPGGAAISCQFSSPIIENNTFKNNFSLSKAGAIYILSNARPIIRKNIFLSNGARSGGAVFWDYMFFTQRGFDNNVFMGNYAVSGCDIMISFSSRLIAHNNTFIRFVDDDYPALSPSISVMDTCFASIFVNSIFSGDIRVQEDLFSYERYAPHFINCNIQNLDTVKRGLKNDINQKFTEKEQIKYNIRENIFDDCFSGEPLFRDVTNLDFHLQKDSPCIDSGALWTKKDKDKSIPDVGAFTIEDYAGGGDYPKTTITGKYTKNIIDEDLVFLNGLHIKYNEELLIKPGVKLKFLDSGIRVDGKLVAEGTEQDSIYFSGIGNSVSWNGLWVSGNIAVDRIIENKMKYHIDNKLGNPLSSFFYYNGMKCYVNNSAESSGVRADWYSQDIRKELREKMIDKIGTINMKYAIVEGSRWSGIRFYYKSKGYVKNSVIRYNRGAGVEIESGASKIANNKIYRNNDSGIRAKNCNADIIDNTISKNYGKLGGGIFCNDDYSNILSNYIFDNYAEKGGGIFLNSGVTKGNILKRNRAKLGGGVYCYYEFRPIIIESNKFLGNSAVNGNGIAFNIDNDNYFENSEYKKYVQEAEKIFRDYIYENSKNIGEDIFEDKTGRVIK